MNATQVEMIYAGNLAHKYDFSLPHSFNTWKRKAINESSIKKGDTVLVFCCGTGLDFPHILKRIGNEGKIIGVDFSLLMLRKAEGKVKKNGWENIELIHADVTKFENALNNKADVGVCTLGMSIIPNFQQAYYNLLSNVKDKGEIIIGDMQLATGKLAKLNPITVLAAKRYGGSFEGHQNARDLVELMNKELIDVRKREFFFKSYFYCIGKKSTRDF